MKQEGDEAREYEAYGFVYIGAKQRGRRKKEGRKKIAAKFGDKIAAERIACPSGYIKRKTVAWVFAKREVGRVSQWLTSLPRYCPREKKKINRVRTKFHSIKMLCAQLRIDDFCFGTNVPVEYRIESNRIGPCTRVVALWNREGTFLRCHDGHVTIIGEAYKADRKEENRRI